MDGFVPWVVVFVCVLGFGETLGDRNSQDEGGGQLFSLEGKVELFSANDTSWIPNTRVLVDGGKYQGFIRTDGQFTVNGLPSGVYIVEVTHPLYEFPPARVYIYRDGRKRASKLDLITPKNARKLKYPLMFRVEKKSKFFQERSSLKIEDIIYNPMAMTILPLIILLVCPQIMSQSLFDPKVQDQFRRQLSTMTGGRGGMIGMGLPNNEKQEDDSSEGEVTEEKNEEKTESEKKTKKKNKKRDKLKNQEQQLLWPFNFDLAEFLADYFYEEKTPKPAEERSVVAIVPHRNRRHRNRNRK